MKAKEESFKRAGLTGNIQKSKIMASGSIISWQIDGETMETVIDFILGSFIFIFGLQNHSKIIAALKLKDACSLEEKL